MALAKIKTGKTGSRSLNKTLLPAIDDAIAAAVEDAATAGDAAYQPLAGNSFTVATVPDATENDGRVIYVSDGDAGDPCAAISDGANWKVLALGATISAS